MLAHLALNLIRRIVQCCFRFLVSSLPSDASVFLRLLSVCFGSSIEQLGILLLVECALDDRLVSLVPSNMQGISNLQIVCGLQTYHRLRFEDVHSRQRVQHGTAQHKKKSRANMFLSIESSTREVDPLVQTVWRIDGLRLEVRRFADGLQVPSMCCTAPSLCSEAWGQDRHHA